MNIKREVAKEEEGDMVVEEKAEAEAAMKVVAEKDLALVEALKFL